MHDAYRAPIAGCAGVADAMRALVFARGEEFVVALSSRAGSIRSAVAFAGASSWWDGAGDTARYRLRLLAETAVAQTDASDGGRSGRLAEEQAALRRAAAHGAETSSLFGLVAEKVSRALHVPFVSVVRFEDDRTATERASFSPEGVLFAPERRWSLVGTSVVSEMRVSGRAARVDDYAGLEGEIAEACRRVGIRSTVGIPVAVGGRTWGAMVVSSTDAEPLPADTEERLADFTDLLATAIANSEAQAEVVRVEEEHAALRRVATLVAQGVPAEALFGAVCDEVEALAGAEASALLRFEADGTATLMGNRSQRAAGASRNPHRPAPVGTRLELDPDGVLAEVHRTGRTARFDTDDPAAPGMPEVIRAERVRSALASPIVVEGELWGAITIGSRERPLAAGMERRLADFTELVATAIANLQARAELAASRARIAAAADEERRRVVRDLHDGAQQRLVHVVITLTLARAALQNGEDDGPALVTEALDNAQQATDELRELAHGILPGVLTHGGLRAGINALRSRTPVPVEIDVSVDRLPAPVEATAYFVVAEALTNMAKHASAGHAEVLARIEDGMLRVEVHDDGVGGASPDGTGLVGLADRLAVLDGRLEIDSPPGGGTRLTAAIPLSALRPLGQRLTEAARATSAPGCVSRKRAGRDDAARRAGGPWLPADHFARFVIAVVEEIDLAAFYAGYRADGHGRPAHDPAMMVARLRLAARRPRARRQRRSLPQRHQHSKATCAPAVSNDPVAIAFKQPSTRPIRCGPARTPRR